MTRDFMPRVAANRFLKFTGRGENRTYVDLVCFGKAGFCVWKWMPYQITTKNYIKISRVTEKFVTV